MELNLWQKVFKIRAKMYSEKEGKTKKPPAETENMTRGGQKFTMAFK